MGLQELRYLWFSRRDTRGAGRGTAGSGDTAAPRAGSERSAAPSPGPWSPVWALAPSPLPSFWMCQRGLGSFLAGNNVQRERGVAAPRHTAARFAAAGQFGTAEERGAFRVGSRGGSRGRCSRLPGERHGRWVEVAYALTPFPLGSLRRQQPRLGGRCQRREERGDVPPQPALPGLPQRFSGASSRAMSLATNTQSGEASSPQALAPPPQHHRRCPSRAEPVQPRARCGGKPAGRPLKGDGGKAKC